MPVFLPAFPKNLGQNADVATRMVAPRRRPDDWMEVYKAHHLRRTTLAAPAVRASAAAAGTAATTASLGRSGTIPAAAG